MSRSVSRFVSRFELEKNQGPFQGVPSHVYQKDADRQPEKSAFWEDLAWKSMLYLYRETLLVAFDIQACDLVRCASSPFGLVSSSLLGRISFIPGPRWTP